MSAPKAINFLLLTLETLAAIHKRGLIHRDLKPTNIIIHKDTLEPWIFDFGIAKVVPLASQGNFTNIGTAAFRAPESVFCADKFLDIYSLGATVLALTNLLKDTDCSWHTVINKCPFPNELKTILLKMVEADFSKRYQNCEDVMTDLKKMDSSVAQSQAPVAQTCIDC